MPTAAPSITPTAASGGAVTVAVPAEPATLDPFAAAGGAPATRDITRLVMPALWRSNAAGERAPWLLAAEPERIDARTIRVALREDAVWSDGKPITIEDLEHTRAHAIAEGTHGYDRIERIQSETPKRARIRFRDIAPDPLDLFSDGLGVLPAHIPVEQLHRAWPVSGGPFTLRRWRSGLDIQLDGNQRAWGGDAPLLDRIRIVFVPDAVGALELLERGEVDVLGPYLAPDWQRRLREVPGVEVSAATGQTWSVLVMNTERAPLSDRRVRRALAHAIDRRRIARGLVGPQGAGLDEAPPGGAGGFGVYGNPAQARALLDRAGWSGSPRRKGGSTLDPTVAFVGEDLTWVVVRAIQFQARQVGFDLQAVPLDTRQLWEEWLGSDEQRAAVLVLRDPPGVLRSSIGVRDGDPASNVSVLPLFAVSVVLGAVDGVAGVCASASPDGPFWNAHTWSLGEAAPGVCPTLVPSAA